VKNNNGNRTDRRPDPTELTPKEAQIWALYEEGKSYREIAEALGLKTTSISTRLMSAKEKIALKNAEEHAA